MRLIDRLWRAEGLLAGDPDADLLDHPPTAGWAAGDLVELAALQLTRGVWAAARIRHVGDRYQAAGLPTVRWPDAIRLAYRNRLADGTAGGWADVAPLGLPADTLQLAGDEECGWLGQTVRDRYRLDARVGRGSLAVVYRAADLVIGGEVAVKLPAGPVLAAVIGPVFRQEAETTARVIHPRVPRALACHDTGPLPALVVEYVPGITLADWQGGRPLDPPAAAAAVRQILEPLEAAHAAGVVHRDLSPSNVLVGPDGEVFVTDWNAALHEAGSTARDGEYAGTPGYASQEGLFGLTARIDPRSDLWGVGALYYELLTARPPAPAADRTEAVVRSATFDPAGLEFPAAVPEPARRVCRTALHPNPALRYGTAAEFRAALAGTDLPATGRLRWVDLFELGHLLGLGRRGKLRFTQHLSQSDTAADLRTRIHQWQFGVAQLILADQTLLEMGELAAAVGLPVGCDPLPDWLSDTIYRPAALPADWGDRLAGFAAGYDRMLDRVRDATEALCVGDEMRAVYRLGYLVAVLPADRLRGELREGRLLGAMPAGVRELLVDLLDETAATATADDLVALFPRRVREWVRAHDEATGGGHPPSGVP